MQATDRQRLSKDFFKHLTVDTKIKYHEKNSGYTVINWQALFILWHLPEREFYFVEIDYLKQAERFFRFEDFKHLKQFILWKFWWDTVDFLAKNIGALVKKEPALIGSIKLWSLDENIWLPRVSLLHQLGFKEETNTELLEEVLVNSLNETEFFIQKAVGWAL